MNRPRKTGAHTTRWVAWLIYALLLTAGIPWYWPKDQVTLVGGIPLWALVALGASVLASCYTAWLLLYRWPEEADDDS